ncbi:MAG: hypothetical protein P1V33_04545 [Pseudohongiella nitratireducens]|nr:hypothetical protein [Pseudohongiella nitratireducens]MDF1622724.1 hypothetical protein [Pseudohongiella nitratireducens]
MSGFKIPPLRQILQLTKGRGDLHEYCDFGCQEEAVDQMITKAKEIYPNKPYCVVGQWTWADLMISSEQKQKLADESGVQPSFIYSDYIFQDNAGRYKRGNWVRSTLLVEFHSPAIFCTKNTSYILVGTGSRISVDTSFFTSFTS